MTDLSDLASPAEARARRRSALALALVSLAALAFRIYLFRSGRLPFDADHAQPGIGALRILREGQLSVFIEGMNYLGDLYALYFAPLHLLFPPCPALLRLGMLPISLLIWLATFQFCRTAFASRAWAIAATALVAFPASMVTDWTTSSASPYMVLLAGTALTGTLLVRLAESLPSEGWTRQNLRRGFGLGLVLGFCFWVHFAMLVTFGAVALTLLASPRLLGRVAGVMGGIGEGAARLPKTLLGLVLQAGLLFGLLGTTYVLLFGGGRLELWLTHITMRHLMKPLLIALGFLLARLAFDLQWLRVSPLPRLGVVSCFLGLWLGAAPVAYHNLTSYDLYFRSEGLIAGSVSVLAQFLSIFHTGLPVLLGYMHDYWQPAHLPPLPLRVMMVAAGMAALAGLLVAALWAEIRHTPRRVGVVFTAALATTQIAVFSLSRSGWLVTDPRYLLLLHWAIAVSLGALPWLLGRLRPGLAKVGWGVVGTLIVLNIWSCLDAPRRSIEGWSGRSPADSEIISLLERDDLTRATSRFAGFQGYWIAHRLSYLSDERVIVAPDSHAWNIGVHSARYQRAVNEAPSIAYLMPVGDHANSMRRFLEGRGVAYQSAEAGGMAVFFDLRPDILRNMTMDQYREASGDNLP